MTVLRLPAATVVAFAAASCGLGVTGSRPLDGGASLDSGFATDASGDAAGGNDAAPSTTPTLSFQSGPASGDVDLTTEGPLDWAHWGLTVTSGAVRKKSGGMLIGEYVPTGTNVQSDNFDGTPFWPIHVSWTDGDTNRPSISGTQTFRYLARATDGVGALSVASGSRLRRLTLYLGGCLSTGRLDMSLSDGSAMPLSDKTQGDTGGCWAVKYFIDYLARSPAASLQLKWSVVSLPQAESSIEIDSAALAEP